MAPQGGLSTIAVQPYPTCRTTDCSLVQFLISSIVAIGKLAAFGNGLFKTIIHLMQVKELKAAVAHELSNRYSSVLASLKSTSVFGMLRSSRSVVAQPSQASSQRSGSSRASPGGGAALRAPQIGGPDAVGRGLQGGGLYIV